jgi:hypothetical protein
MLEKKIKLTISVFISAIFIVIAIVLFSLEKSSATASANDSLQTASRSSTKRAVREFYYNFNPTDSIFLCGERLPLEDAEVFERFERDFLINVNDRVQIMMYLKRAGRFFPHIEKKLAEAGLPDDFKYLAVAESKLMDLRSPAGAAGIWQIMPETGREYGLIVNSDIDERYHFERATDVAIQYLASAYKRFGNWAVVAASYNMGMGGVSNEIRQQQTANYYDLWLNRETARYVFRIAAIKECMKNPAKYGYESTAVFKPIETREVQVFKAVPNLVEWAVAQGTTFKTLKFLNPWIRGRSLPQPPARGFFIQLPKSGSLILASDYIAIPASDSVAQDLEK